MGKRSAVVELFLGDMGSIQRELRPSIQREDQLTMETKLEQIAVKAVNQLPKSVVREIRTPRSVGAGGGRPPPATRWDGKRSVAEWPKLPRPSSTLPTRTWALGSLRPPKFRLLCRRGSKFLERTQESCRRQIEKSPLAQIEMS